MSRIEKVLTQNNIRVGLRNMRGVRSPLELRAKELQRSLEKVTN